MQSFVRYHDVLGKQANEGIYRAALAMRETFARSRTFPGRFNPDWRRSMVLYDHHLGGVVDGLHRAVHRRLEQVVELLGIPRFATDGLEVQLTSHNDGEYYRSHVDSGRSETAARVVTFVYYVHAEPKRYSGGELVLYPPQTSPQVIEPLNDSLVFFSSTVLHEVRTVTCPSHLFEDGRFSINGWVRRRTLETRQSYFDAKIFSRPTRAREHRPALPAPAADVPRAAGGEPTRREPPATMTSDPEALPSRLMRLYGELHRRSRRSTSVDELPEISQASFFEDYYCSNRPLVLRGAMRASKAVRTWSPELLAERFGAVFVQITSGRDQLATYEHEFRLTLRTVTLREFVERLVAEPVSNDYYLVARNYFFDDPTFRVLLQDLEPPVHIIDFRDERRGACKLWFGPGGTITPFHYDEHPILFGQIYGRKRFKLVSPFDGQKMYVHHRYYSAVDPENVDEQRYPAFHHVSVAEVLVEPGDLLFIPTGWWHWVKSIDVSISSTFSSFRMGPVDLARPSTP